MGQGGRDHVFNGAPLELSHHTTSLVSKVERGERKKESVKRSHALAGPVARARGRVVAHTSMLLGRPLEGSSRSHPTSSRPGSSFPAALRTCSSWNRLAWPLPKYWKPEVPGRSIEPEGCSLAAALGFL